MSAKTKPAIRPLDDEARFLLEICTDAITVADDGRVVGLDFVLLEEIARRAELLYARDEAACEAVRMAGLRRKRR